MYVDIQLYNIHIYIYIYIYIYAETEEQVIMKAVQAHDVFVLCGATGRFTA